MKRYQRRTEGIVLPFLLFLVINLTASSNAFITAPGAYSSSVRQLSTSSFNKPPLNYISRAKHNKNPTKHTTSLSSLPDILTTTILTADNNNDVLTSLIYQAQSLGSDLASTILSPSTTTSTSIISPLSISLLYTAGLLTSFSPCSFALLPLTLSYISTATGERDDKTAFLPTVAFAAGLSVVFCALGISASLVGGVVLGGGGSILAVGASMVSLVMGLQLLDLVRVPLPSLEVDLPWEDDDIPDFDEDGNVIMPAEDEKENDDVLALFRTFLLGGSSALVSSPCATPVLTSILAYVASNGDGGGSNTAVGSLLLFAYTLGYSTPLLLIGATGGEALAKLQDMGKEDGKEGGVVKMIGRSVNPILASVLIAYGTNGFLVALFGDPSLAGLAPILE